MSAAQKSPAIGRAFSGDCYLSWAYPIKFCVNQKRPQY